MSAPPPPSPEHLVKILEKCLSDERVTDVCLFITPSKQLTARDC